MIRSSFRNGLVAILLSFGWLAGPMASPGNVPAFENNVPAAGPPLEIALQHVRQTRGRFGLTEEDLADVVVQNQYISQRNQTTHIYLRQRFGQLVVANAQVNINIASDGRVINMGNSFVPNLKAAVNTISPDLSATDAIKAAAGQLELSITGTLEETSRRGGPGRAATFSGAGLSMSDIPAELVLYATGTGSVRLAWQISIQQTDQKHYWNLFVDAVTGDILDKIDWMAHDSYEVYEVPKESPSDGPRTIASDPAESVASPYGWHDTDGSAGAEFTDTRGNNVSAQEDRDANNSGGYRPSASSNLDFASSLVLNQTPVTYRDAAITNLFYWNNVIHDILYQYGFDEASGNFQENNYGRGGSGSDSVNADAQDGSGTNNANFSTPPDGFNPRMQMFEWTPPADAVVTVNAPAAIAGDFIAAAAGFGGTLTSTGVTDDVELVDDGSAAGSEGCETLTGFTAGRVAMIDRGNCEFGTKVLNAQNAGAIAAIVVNNEGGGVIPMGPGAQGNQVSIPSVMIAQSDGSTIKSELDSGTTVNTTLKGAGNTIPNRDSDLDNGIIAHEYCHGLSIRLTGGAGTSNCLSGSQQAGEGWSDFCALALTAAPTDQATTSRGVGTYVLFEPADTGLGIRPYPYTTDMAANPLTYGELATNSLSVPHGVGTVWATTLWDMYWNLVADHGFDPDLYNGTGGNNIAIQLVVDGLKLQPCNPTFLDARDAILLADQNNNSGVNQCRIWEAFARRGMGFSAADGGNANSLNVTEAFDLPAQCSSTPVCGDGVCDIASGIEDQGTCPDDCSLSRPASVCGNGLCEAGDGQENCSNCPQDCAGLQTGKPSNRFCCGSASDMCDPTACNTSESSCSTAEVGSGEPAVCGDGQCDAPETPSQCPFDCDSGGPICGDGFCEGLETEISCPADCGGGGTGGSCPDDKADLGESCVNDSDCCSNKCRGKSGAKTCK